MTKGQHAPQRRWVRSHLHALRKTWHMTDGCIAPDCQRPAMKFPPSRYCKNHCDYVPPNVGGSVTIPPTPHEEF